MHAQWRSGTRAPVVERHGSPMSAGQRDQFERDGFLMVRGALSPDEIERYTAAVDAAYEWERRLGPAGRFDTAGSLQKISAVAHCPTLAHLVDHPAVLPLVWSVMGWNIHLTHSHFDVHPPLPGPRQFRWRWHQDGGRQNIDIETDPRPRMAVYVAFWLSDVSQPGRGNMAVIPGSHTLNWLSGPPGPEIEWPKPPGAIEVTAEPGDVLFYDRRLWHTRTDNHSALVRKAVFFGYTYRWVSIRDEPLDLSAHPELGDLSPVQRQLLGIGDDTGDGYWGHSPDAVPLYAELRDAGLLDPTNRPHKRLFP